MANINFSRIILGFWRLQDITANEVKSLLGCALDAGIDTIDQADIYGNYTSQSILGRAFKQDKGLRKNYKIISKTGIVLKNKPNENFKISFYNTTRNHIEESVNKTLSDLGTDYIDMLLIHRPDMLMDPIEIDEVFKDLRATGKVLNFGVSNFTPAQVDMMSTCMETPLAANQVEFSVLKIDPLFNGTLDQCIQKKIMPMAWSPLGGGCLFTSNNEQAHRVRQTLQNIAKEIGSMNLDTLALAWLLKHPSKAYPVIGTQNPKRIESAIDSINITLSNEQWYRILTASQGNPVP